MFCRTSTGVDLTKIVKILYYVKLYEENNFGSIIYSTHQKKSKIVERKSFLANLFIPLIVRKVSTKF